mgnify:CR=1 FL=1|tara:strand:+ start:1469 stop:5872 length:4404 start_codon:yes stop_codon:yes gene_type:complete
MNEQALQDAYSLFQQEGYNKSFDDFVNLLNTNDEALQDAYNLFSETGYTKSINDFSTLMGVKKKEESEFVSPLEMDFTEYTSPLVPKTIPSASTVSEEFVGTAVADPQVFSDTFAKQQKQNEDYKNFFLERENKEAEKLGVFNVVQNSFKSAVSNYEKSYKDTQASLYDNPSEKDLISDSDEIARDNKLRRDVSLNQLGVSEENREKNATELLFQGNFSDGLKMLFADGLTAAFDAPRTLLPFLVPGAGPLFTGLTSASQEAANLRYDPSLSDQEKKQRSILSGFIEGASTGIAQKLGVGLPGLTKKISPKAAEGASDAVQALRGFVTTGLGEGVEEGFVDVANQVKDKAFDLSYGRESQDFNLYQALDAAFLGTIAGSAVKGATMATSLLPSTRKAGHSSTVEERSEIEKEVQELSRSYFNEADPDIRKAKEKKLNEALNKFDSLLKKEGDLHDAVEGESKNQLVAINRRIANLKETLKSGKDAAGIKLNSDQIANQKSELNNLFTIKKEIEDAVEQPQAAPVQPELEAVETPAETDQAPIETETPQPVEGEQLNLFEQQDVEGFVNEQKVQEAAEASTTELPFEANRLDASESFMGRVERRLANKYAPIFSLQKQIQKAKGKDLDLDKDFINAETTMYGATAKQLDILDNKVKPVAEQMKSSQLTQEEVAEFLTAKHASERNAVISERTDGNNVEGSGMSNARAEEILDGLPPKKRKALDEISRQVYEVTADTRKAMVEYGLESQETIDAFENMFDFYVPLAGQGGAIDEQTSSQSLYPTGGVGFNVVGKTTKEAKGRKTEATNILAQVIAQNAAVHVKGKKNETLTRLYNLVKENPDSKVWRTASEGQVKPNDEGAVGVRINGKQQYIVFQNPDLAKNLQNMGVEKLGLFAKLSLPITGALRKVFTTISPEFIISNFARDIQFATVNAAAESDIEGGLLGGTDITLKIAKRTRKTLPALLKGAFGKDMDAKTAAYFEDFQTDGGQTGWGFVKDLESISKEIESQINDKSKARKATEWMAKNSIRVIENMNEAFENSIRLATYIEAREAGVSREKAAELSKEITVNFNRSGELGPALNAWFLFFTASVQGTARLGRSLTKLKPPVKPDGVTREWYERINNAQKITAGLSLMSGMLAMVNMGLSDEDEDGVLFYSKIPDYEKERNLIFMYDGKNYFKVPLPYGLNVFSNMGTAMAEVAAGEREKLDAGMFLINSAFSSFSPVSFGQSKDLSKYVAKGVTPTAFKPLIDIAVNESYFGSSIYAEQMKGATPKPESEISFRAPEDVRAFFKFLNQATGGTERVPGKLDFNADKFWYGLEYYGGGAGQFVTRSLGTGRDLYETITSDGKKVNMSAKDFPFLRKLYGEASRFYDSDKYTENTILTNQLFKERKDSSNKSDKRYRGITQLEALRKQTNRKVKLLRKRIKEAREIKDYIDRQNRIDFLYEQQRKEYMRFNKRYEQLRGKNSK